MGDFIGRYYEKVKEQQSWEVFVYDLKTEVLK